MTLLPCPFCGKPAKEIISFGYLFYIICSNNSERHVVEMGPYKKKSDAIKQWNKRTEGKEK